MTPLTFRRSPRSARRPVLVHRRLEYRLPSSPGSVGATFGMLAVNTTLYVGPLADIAGGVDLSTIGSAALAGLIYVASLRFIKA